MISFWIRSNLIDSLITIIGAVATELLQFVRTVQKSPHGRKYKILSNILTSYFKRSQFCFKLNSFVIVEMDIFIYEEASLLIGFERGSVNTLCLQDGEEIFG